MPVTTIDVGLTAALAAASRRVHARIHAVVSPEGLTVEQWSVLDHVARTPASVAMSAVAEASGLTGPSLTRAVDKLVTSALMFREVDAGDRRRVLVDLSKRGAELHARLATQVEAAEHELAGSPSAAGRLVETLGGLAR